MRQGMRVTLACCNPVPSSLYSPPVGPGPAPLLSVVPALAQAPPHSQGPAPILWTSGTPLPCPLIRVDILLLHLHLFVSRINETKIAFWNFGGFRDIPLGRRRYVAWGAGLLLPESVNDSFRVFWLSRAR